MIVFKQVLLRFIFIFCLVSLVWNNTYAQDNFNKKELQDLVLWIVNHYEVGEKYMMIDKFFPHKSNEKLLKTLSKGRIFLGKIEDREKVNIETGEITYYAVPKDTILVEKSEYNNFKLSLSDTFYWDQVMPNPDRLISYNEYLYIADSINTVNNNLQADEKKNIYFYIAPPVYLKSKMVWYFPKIYLLDGCTRCNLVNYSLFITKEQGKWKIYFEDK